MNRNHNNSKKILQKKRIVVTANIDKGSQKPISVIFKNKIADNKHKLIQGNFLELRNNHERLEGINRNPQHITKKSQIKTPLSHTNRIINVGHNAIANNAQKNKMGVPVRHFFSD